MNKRWISVVLLSGAAVATLCFAQTTKKSKQPAAAHGATPASAPKISTPANIQWGPAPPVVPAGAQAAVLSGDPFKPGAAFSLRLKMPSGYKIPPHHHPTDEHVTGDLRDVCSGHGRQV